MSIGENIRFYRKLMGLSQKELAKKAFCDRSYIALIECGRKLPSAAIIKIIAEALNVTPNELYGVKEAGNDTANC